MRTAESDTVAYEFATDALTIEDGKIILQTVGFVKCTEDVPLRLSPSEPLLFKPVPAGTSQMTGTIH